MARAAHLLSAFSLFLIALLARLAAIGRYVTPDELNWVYRSLGLRRALLSADWANTIQSGHPGVTTTWIGALSVQVQQWLQPGLQPRLAWLDRMQQLSADNVEAFRHLYAFLNGGRLGVALVISLILVLLYLQARHLLGAPAAFLGALLLALDPFFAGLSGLLHVDALLATFTLLALVLALRAARTGSRSLAAMAGVGSALAILTKTPGLLAPAFVPLILLWPAARHRWRRRRRAMDDGAGPAARGPETRRAAAGNVIVWAGALAASTTLLLPALWSDPRHVVEVVGGLSGRLVADAVRPTFFLGRTALDHGPLFYPLVLLFRLSPVAMGGLALAIPAALRRRGDTAADSARWLLLFALVFVIAISIAAKKFDRYALPALLMITFVAGWGLLQLASFVRQRGASVQGRIWATAVLLQLAFLIGAWPHPLTAYNWLAGGNAVARNVFPSGWGEDAGLAARRLNASLERPRQARLFTGSLTGTAPFFAGEIVRLREPNLTRLQPDDYILTLPQDRRSQATRLWPLESGNLVNGSTVRGVGEAFLYSGLQAADLQLPSLALEERHTHFGPALSLAAAGSVFLPWPQETLLALSWQRDSAAELSAGYRLQLELKNDAGQVWLRRELPLLNEADHAPPAWPVGTPQTVFYTISLPATLAPGDYEWVVKLFDDEGRQQAVFGASGAFAGTEAGVARIALAPPPSQPPPDIPQPIDGAGPLAGHGGLPEAAAAGDPFSLDIWLRAQDLEAVELVLVAGGRQLPFRLQTNSWREGQIYQVRPRWRLPVDLAPGEQELEFLLREANGERVAGGPVVLGTVQVERRERRYELPAALDTLQVQVGDIALLQDVDIEIQEDQVLVHVTWQALQATFTDYTTFVHLRDGEQVIAGDDRQPLPATSRWARGEVIEETYTLPRPNAGAYNVAVGLYDATNGERLPLRDPAGAQLPGDQYVLEVTLP